MTFVRLMNKVVWIQLKIHHIEIDTCWRHQMETYSASLALCAGNSPAPDEFPAKRPVAQSFDVFFDLRPNRRFSKRGEAGDMKRHRAHYDVIVMRILAVYADITPAVTLERRQSQSTWMLSNSFCRRMAKKNHQWPVDSPHKVSAIVHLTF